VSDEGHKMIILSSSINGQHQLISFSLGFFFFLLQLMCFINTQLQQPEQIFY